MSFKSNEGKDMKNTILTNRPTETVSQATKIQTKKGSTMYEELKKALGSHYKNINTIIKDFKKNNQTEYQNLLNNVEQSFNQNKFNERIGYILGVNISSLFSDVLGYVFDTSSGLDIQKYNQINYENISKDKSFMIFYTKLYIYTQLVKNNTIEDIKIKFLFDIKSLILTYFFIHENKITETKVLNLLSFFFKNSIITLNEKDRTEENNEKIRLITTGVKYIKEKINPLPTNNPLVVHKSKSTKFDLLQHLSTRITIKYDSGKNNKHISHKKPEEHIRSGHYRFYKKTGKKVWIDESIINKGVNNTNQTRKVS